MIVGEKSFREAHRLERSLGDPSSKVLRFVGTMDISVCWFQAARCDAICRAARDDKNNRYVIRSNYTYGVRFHIARRSDFNDRIVARVRRTTMIR